MTCQRPQKNFVKPLRSRISIALYLKTTFKKSVTKFWIKSQRIEKVRPEAQRVELQSLNSFRAGRYRLFEVGVAEATGFEGRSKERRKQIYELNVYFDQTHLCYC